MNAKLETFDENADDLHMDCPLCENEFDPRNSPCEEFGGLFICSDCANSYDAEELAIRVDEYHQYLETHFERGLSENI